MISKKEVTLFKDWLHDNGVTAHKKLIKDFKTGKLNKTKLFKYYKEDACKWESRGTLANNSISPIPLVKIKSIKPIKLERAVLSLPVDSVEYLLSPYPIETVIDTIRACGIIEGVVRISLHDLLSAGESGIQALLAELLLDMSHPDIVEDVEYTFMGSDDQGYLYFNVSCTKDPQELSDSIN